MLIFTSCKKENETKTIGGEEVELVFTLTGMKEVNTVGTKQSNSRSINSVSQNYEDIAMSTTKIGNVDLITSSVVEPIKISFEGSNSGLYENGLKRKLAANIPMEDGIKYMILIYNNVTGDFVTSALGTAGQAIKIPVHGNINYKWYAYSYNTTTDITVPVNKVVPTIPTPTDSDLLYTSGIVNVGGPADYPISILFEHKLSLIQVELDYDRMFAQMRDYDLEFANTTFLNKGTFNLLNGSTTDIVPYTITSLNDHLIDDPTGEKIKVAKFYVADPSPIPTSFDVVIDKLSVKYSGANPTVDTELIGPSSTLTTKTVEFGAFTPIIGQKFIAKIKLWHSFKPRTILHVTRTGADTYSYAAQRYFDGSNYYDIYTGAAYWMINDTRNYGMTASSKVRAGAFTHQRCYLNNSLDGFLTAATKPDITIISVYYLMDDNDRTALINYINAGGVVLLMTDGVNVADRIAQQPFFRDFFGDQSITLQDNGFGRGTLYAFKDINDEILNGPFGDLRPDRITNVPKYWGEDASATTTLANIPSDQITYYSEAAPANRVGTPNGVTMFKHNYKNFFWIGDGGFLSNPTPGAGGTYGPADYGAFPFATRAADNYPVSKLYGEGTANGFTLGTTPVWNSVLFANVMSWAIVNAEFFGINTGGLPTDPADYVIF